MKLAPHRSITFWSGILVMGFICWVWWDSERHVTVFYSKHWHLDHSRSGVSIGHNKLDPYRTGAFRASLPEAGYDDPRSRLRGEWYASGSKRVELPHWLLLLAVALPWSTLQLWRGQRRKRLA